MLESSDFQCPNCAEFARSTFQEIDSRYIKTGSVLLAFRHYPVESLHPNAFKAAISAECAGQEGKFWEMHDRLFNRRGEISFDRIVEDARAMDLPMSQFHRCVTGDGQQQVRRDMSAARQLRVTGTPTIFVGVRQSAEGEYMAVSRISGAQRFDVFERAIEYALESSVSRK